MMFFTKSLETYFPRNLACRKLIDYVREYKHILIKDELSLDAFIEEIRVKVNEINAEHPKLLKRIHFSSDFMYNGEYSVSASIGDSRRTYNIFLMEICRVQSIYQFSQNIDKSKVTVAPGICRICGCTENNPCFHPDLGTCWWADDEHTLCSHCANPQIADDPETVHCVNTNKECEV